MSFDHEQSHVLSLHDAVVEIKATLNNGLKAQLIEQKAELKSVKDDVQLIRDALTGHVAKEEASRAGEFHPHALSRTVREPLDSYGSQLPAVRVKQAPVREEPWRSIDHAGKPASRRSRSLPERLELLPGPARQAAIDQLQRVVES